MLVIMEPYMNVPSKDCALLLHVMERIKASSQPCITQQFILPHVEAFSSTLILWITGCIIRIIVIAVLLLLHIRMLLSGGPMLLSLCAIAGLGLGLLCGRLGVGLLLVVVAELGGIRVFHLLSS